MTAVMSTSLNVVSIAACCCACSKRSAMRARSRVMATRCSLRGGPPAGGVGSGANAGAAQHVVLDADSRRLMIGDVIEHVALRDTAFAARARDRGRVEVVLFDELAHGRTHLVGGGRRSASAPSRPPRRVRAVPVRRRGGGGAVAAGGGGAAFCSGGAGFAAAAALARSRLPARPRAAPFPARESRAAGRSLRRRRLQRRSA